MSAIDEGKGLLRNLRAASASHSPSPSTSSSDDEGYSNGNGGGGGSGGYSKDSYYRQKNVFHTKFFRKILLCGLFVLVCVLLYIPLSNNVTPRIVAIEGWALNTSRDPIEYVIPNLNTTLIDPINICQGKKFILLVVVCSSVNNFYARYVHSYIEQTIRETWGNVTEFNYHLFYKMHSHLKGKYLDIKMSRWRNYVINSKLENSDSSNNDLKTYRKSLNSSRDKKFPVKIVFLVGKIPSNETQSHLIEESEQYNDIIQENFLDSYNNLTIKSIMLLKWVNNNCVNKVKFVMKCDDDTFLNIPNLLHVLLGGTVPLYNATISLHDVKTVHVMSTENRIQNDTNLLLGCLICRAKPIADTTSKWYSPIYMFRGNFYPNYLSGIGYVMSIDILQKLYNASLTTSVFHLEDIYVTGICASKVNLHPHNHPLFIYSNTSNQCGLKGMIALHGFPAEDLRKAYEYVINFNTTCPPPDKTFNARKVRLRQKGCY